MKPKIYIAQDIPKEVEEYIAKHCDYRKWESQEFISYDSLCNEIKDSEGLLLSTVDVDRNLLEKAPQLKVVSNISVGYNNFDIEAMRERNIIGTNTPFVLDETVADLVLGLIISVARRIPELDQVIRTGNWKDSDDVPYYGADVHHTTLGIIGMGRIGEEIARRGKLGFNMEVQYYNRNRKLEIEKNLGVKYTEMKELLRSSDFIVLMTPLTPETEKLMGRDEFNLMKNTAFFINASRGQTVDEEALIDALKKGKIAGAGLDVFEEEPVNLDNPLIKMKNVVLLPHVGTATYRTSFDMAMLAAENLVKALSGEYPPNIVKELKDCFNAK
jgi:gluconate 2-dehydrogenase